MGRSHWPILAPGLELGGHGLLARGLGIVVNGAGSKSWGRVQDGVDNRDAWSGGSSRWLRMRRSCAVQALRCPVHPTPPASPRGVFCVRASACNVNKSRLENQTFDQSCLLGPRRRCADSSGRCGEESMPNVACRGLGSDLVCHSIARPTPDTASRGDGWTVDCPLIDTDDPSKGFTSEGHRPEPKHVMRMQACGDKARTDGGDS
jgi:hypothetical protein